MSDTCRIIDRKHTVLTYTLNGRKQYIVEQNDALSGPIRRHVYEIISELGHDWGTVYNYFDKLFNGNMSANYERVIDQLTI